MCKLFYHRIAWFTYISFVSSIVVLTEVQNYACALNIPICRWWYPRAAYLGYYTVFGNLPSPPGPRGSRRKRPEEREDTTVAPPVGLCVFARTNPRASKAQRWICTDTEGDRTSGGHTASGRSSSVKWWYFQSRTSSGLGSPVDQLPPADPVGRWRLCRCIQSTTG